MFKKAKRKIVISILAILCTVLVGTLGMVYLTSYMSVTSQNYQILNEHAEMLTNNKDIFFKDGKEPMKGKIRGRGKMERNLQVGTFYAVKISSSGDTQVIENGAEGIYSDDDLIALSKGLVSKEKGRTGKLLYIVLNRSDETVIVFMDNTVFADSFSMLFVFTMVFGVIALIAIAFISNYIAGRIVAPMEETYQKQKQFTADAGHELKTPIAAVSANVELLRREIGDNKWLSNIEFENERMKTLVTELLELAKNENKRADKKPTDLSRLVTGNILPLEAAAFEKGIVLETNIESGIIADIDETSVAQLVTILVDNAISHTISETGDSPKVTVNITSSKGNAVLTISNPGEEIPESERDKIFERFYRTDSSHEFTGHYGLGLAIAKSIADLNNAKISLSCSDGLVCMKVVFQ